MTHQLETYRAAGMNGSVAKPIEVGQLFAAIAAALPSIDSEGAEQPRSAAV